MASHEVDVAALAMSHDQTSNISTYQSDMADMEDLEAQVGRIIAAAEPIVKDTLDTRRSILSSRVPSSTSSRNRSSTVIADHLAQARRGLTTSAQSRPSPTESWTAHRTLAQTPPSSSFTPTQGPSEGAFDYLGSAARGIQLERPPSYGLLPPATSKAQRAAIARVDFWIAIHNYDSVSVAEMLVGLQEIPDVNTAANGFPAICFIACAPSARRADALQLLRILIMFKVDMTATDGALGRDTLHWAASKNDRAMLELLIKHGMDLDTQDDDERTAVNLAASYGYFDRVDLLAKSGADLTIRDIHNRIVGDYQADQTLINSDYTFDDY